MSVSAGPEQTETATPVAVHRTPPSLPEGRRAVLYAVRRRGDATVEQVASQLEMTESGARQHLSALVDAGLLHAAPSTEPRSTRGRVPLVYAVTPAGDALFPKAYGELTNELLGYLTDEEPDTVDRLFSRRRDARIANGRARLDPLPTLEAKVAELATILDEDGYLASWEPDGEGGYRVVEHNCAIWAVASTYGQACTSEIDFIRAVLPEARVERTQHMVEGARRCAYQITPTDVLEAAFWAALGAAALPIGAELAFAVHLSRRTIGLIMAFGVGALISAVSYELVEEALDATDGWAVVVGMVAGAATYFVGDLLIERQGGGERMKGGTDDARPKAIVLGTVLDGIPESLVLGLSLVLGGGVSVGLLAGIFISNLPESVGASQGLLDRGVPRRRIRQLWLLLVLVSATASAVGYGLLADASPTWGAVIQAFAGGALLTMIADTLAPEAYEDSGTLSGLLTTAGFIVALTLSRYG